MFDAFRRFLSDCTAGDKHPSRFGDNDYRLAASALLVHAAAIDGEISQVGRDKLHAVIKRRFDLDEAATDELVVEATAAEKQAVDLYHFTSLVWGFFCQGFFCHSVIWPRRSPFRLLFRLLGLSIGCLSTGRRRSTAMSQAVPARRQTPAQTRRSKASLPVVATSRHNLVFGGSSKSSKIRTMMQPCASAARLLEGGPILSRGVEAMGGGGSPPTRIVLAFASKRRNAEPSNPVSAPVLFQQIVHIAARSLAPTGTAPVLT
jgi:tellurite resistance protein TerB